MRSVKFSDDTAFSQLPEAYSEVDAIAARGILREETRYQLLMLNNKKYRVRRNVLPTLLFCPVDVYIGVYS